MISVEMKAITLNQPFAQLVALGAKRYHPLTWITHYRGPLAIHASLEFPDSAWALCRCEPFATALLGNTDLPLGCVVAICDLAAVTPTATDDALPPENGRVILAHGEVTGHAHEIAEPAQATLREMEEAVRLLGDLSDAGTMTQAGLVLTDDSSVVHQEHATIPLAKGKYIVRRQREYTPEAIINVAD